MSITKLSVFSCMTILALSASCSAQYPVFFNPDTGAPITALGVAPSMTGETTAGATVTVWYNYAPAGVPLVETVPISSPAPTEGEALGGMASGMPLWRLRIVGDTAAAPWIFEGLSPGGYEINRMEIDLLPSDSGFDKSNIHAPGNTPGSVGGVTFANGGPTVAGTGAALAISVTYVNPIRLPSAPPQGDMFGKLDIGFVGGFGGLDTMFFPVDTDLLDFPPIP